MVGLGGWVARWRTAVLVAWAVVTVVGAVVGGSVYDRTESLDGLRPDVESSQAQARLDRLDPQGDEVVAVIAGREFFSPELVTQASRIMFEIRELDGVAEVVDAFTAGGPVGDDGESSIVVVELDRGLDEDEALAVADRVAEALHEVDAPIVLVGGELLAERTFAEQAIADTVRGESMALVVLCVVLVLLLGGLRVGVLPLVAALAVIATTLLALSALAGVVDVNEYAVNIVTLLGIGLAVDYSLLMIYRFREERAADRKATIEVLVERTTATAGRAVLISGLAVTTAMAGLVVFAEPLLATMALGGALVVALATVAGLTLVPALIAVAHRHVPAPGTRTWVWRGQRRRGPGVLARLAGFSQARPLLVALGVAAGLVLLAVPLTQLELANSDARVLPADSEERRSFEEIEERFDPASLQPLSVLVDGEPDDPDVRDLITAIDALPDAGDVYVRADLDRVVRVEVVPEGPPAGARAQALVRDVRALDGPPAQVAGPAAELVDAKDSTRDRIPFALILVLVATFVLLFVLTGSVVVPLKALVLNLLTLAATLGVLVAVFQWGWGAGVLGFEPWGAIDLTTPLLLFVFIFGLSMDYEVFLLARIKEEWDRRTADTGAASDRAVLVGITATGPVVTAAAVCIGIVFLGFVVGELVPVKEIGVGMAVAVLLDVTVVRGLLLPAVMGLLGRWNWWSPFGTAAPVPAVPTGKRGRPPKPKPKPVSRSGRRP